MKCGDIKAGELRTPIKLKHVIKDRAGQRGGYKEIPETYAVAMARVKVGSGRRSERGDFDQITQDLDAVLRFRDDLEDSDVVEVDGVDYRLAAPPENVEFKRRWLRLKLGEVPQ